jgi:hypothetical protein
VKIHDFAEFCEVDIGHENIFKKSQTQYFGTKTGGQVELG